MTSLHSLRQVPQVWFGVRMDLCSWKEINYSARPVSDQTPAALERVARMGTVNAAQEAMPVKDAITSHFTTEDAVSWQHLV
ncbi:hypothetical protein DPEC_G00113780 [Dallia pectoralis]|uniref:Uncharacterized protein n=1 Tax=Dallia pectoralis TaxID=75939 RepID=A0ACC2GUJ1_DALPE|nr:hypothetical protein DPEC_G00113780 [Dallia pectoralis]